MLPLCPAMFAYALLCYVFRHLLKRLIFEIIYMCIQAFKLFYQDSEKFPMGLVASLWQTSSCLPCQKDSCVQCQKIRRTLNLCLSFMLLPTLVQSSSIYFNIAVAIITCYLAYKPFHYRMFFFFWLKQNQYKIKVSK